VETYILGAVTAIVAAGIGAYLTFRFDILRGKQEDESVFEAFKEELISSIEMLSANSVELEEEVKWIGVERLSPLSPLYIPTWDVLKTRLPMQLASKDVFRKLALTMDLMLVINEHERSREAFKINGVSIHNYSNTLAQRDNNILILNARLLKRILELREALGLKIEFSSHRSETLTTANKEFNAEQAKLAKTNAKAKVIQDS
jgi:hypothetical protein